MSHPSLKSRIFYHTLKSMGFSRKSFGKLLDGPRRNTGAFSPSRFSKKLITEESIVQGSKVLTLSSKAPGKKHVVYFHGGAFVAEAFSGHRNMIEKLTLSSTFKISFIDYPLAPENNAQTTTSVVMKAYEALAKNNPQDQFYLLGDSAGGGLALTMLHMLRDGSISPFPKKTALVSPWLDISMSNPEIGKYMGTDVLLNQDGLKQCGRLYADQLDLKDPIVSPLYGNMEDLSQLKIWVSNNELFYPDCILLQNNLDAAKGSSSCLRVKEKMIHDWIVFPIKERNETLSEIIDFFNDENA